MGDDVVIYGSSSHQWDCRLVNDDSLVKMKIEVGFFTSDFMYVFYDLAY